MRRSPGSVLLLTVMIIAVLTTTTLGAVAIRFEQLSSTEKINNSSVAKLAADSGLAKLKEKLTLSTPIVPTVYDLDKNQETTNGVDLATYKPSPRSITSGYEKASSSLPRCLAVAVLAPWTNAGQYLFQEDDASNPSLIFHYANIVNDTPLGTIPGNNSINSDEDKLLPLSELTKMGHFYNPYAPTTASQGNKAYWSIKLGGPQDEFLTRKNSDASGSYYASLDFVYIPYLPRFVDTAITTSGGSQTGLDRLSAAEYRSKFETLIKKNNLKIWLDSSIKDSVIQDYGFADLFTESNSYRVSWLQPSLWNDLPEADLATTYKTENVDNTPTDPWTKKNQPLFTSGNGSNGWDVDILRGSKTFGFWRLNSNAGATAFTPGATIAALYYGSLEGIRLQQKFAVTLIRRSDRGPLTLQNRSSDQGKLYDVRITEITVAGNSVTMKLALSNSAYQTPLKSDGRAITWSDLDSIVVSGNPAQFSTKNSIGGSTLTDAGADGRDVVVSASSSCVTSAALAACPAQGDIISLNKAGSTPVWGQVKSTRFTGTTLAGFTLDALRAYPKPTRNQAFVSYVDSLGNPMIAYYGGEIVMNDYDGGFNSEADELWLYNPETDIWTYPTQIGSQPGRLAGASMVFDTQNKRLVVFGGYYHDAVAITEPAGTIDCQQTQSTCLYTNQAGLRVAKRVLNDVYAYTLSSGTWEKISYPFIDPSTKIQAGTSYQMRVVSTLPERSGLERWKFAVRADTNGGAKVVVNVDGSTATTVRVTPSAAGVAKGDEMYVFSRNPNFDAWARVTAVDYPNDTITLMVRGNSRSAQSVQLDELIMQVITRQTAAAPCMGAINAGQYSCTISGDTTGYAVGDQIVLDQYQAGHLEQSLSGFISHMTAGGSVSFVADERIGTLKDYRDNSGVGQIFNESAIAFPVGRYGATLQVKPGDPQANKQINYLYQGNTKNIANSLRISEIWQMDFTNGLISGPASVAWGIKPKAINNPAPSTSENYNFKVIRSNYQSQIFTPTNGASAPAVIKDNLVTDPKTGQQRLEWDNSKTWDLTIDTAGNELNAPSRLVAGAGIVIERANGTDGPSPNSREVFTGTIVSTFSGGYNATIIRIKHKANSSGDSGLAVHSKNAKITIFSTYRTDVAIYGKARWVASSGGYLRLSNVSSDEVSRIPSSGLSVMFWRETGGKIDAYTMTVKNRTYEVGVNEFRFSPDDQPYKSPSQVAYGTNAVTSPNGSDAYTLALSEYQLSSNGQGAAEWFANAKDANPTWEMRISDTDSGQIDDRPAPRQGGALGSIYIPGTTKSQLYLVGGTFGRWADLWKMDDAGKINGSDDIRWKIGKASAQSGQDLPNLFGGSMALYQKNGAVKAIYFGGKMKTDASSNDYNKYFGARVLGEPDVNNFSITDNSFYLPDNATVDSVGFVKTLANNFPAATVSNDVKTVANSLKLSATPIPSGYTKTVCRYLGQVCSTSSDSSPLMQNIGSLGRISGNASTYAGFSWGSARVVVNPGTAFLKEGSGGNEKARLVSGISAMSSAKTNGRWDQDGYYPYECDSGSGCSSAPYGTTTTSYSSDKTMMTAGFATITGASEGGSILVTTTAVGTAIASNRGGTNDTTGRWYSYCADYNYQSGNSGGNNFTCKDTATRYLKWLPDPEDLVFMFNAALTLSSTDTYRVIGYHGGAKRGYQVIRQPGRDPIVFEIVP